MMAGESIYLLPYMRKTFQTSMEVVFQIDSAEVGLLNSLFGVFALLCYFPSGWLADRFSARRLLTLSLICTSAGGYLMLSLPSYPILLGIHAFWGITSILTFWSALIKATRKWGTPSNQGKSFGLLDGGRGLVEALLASVATAFYALGTTVQESLQSVLIVYATAPLITGILIWIIIPEEKSVKSVHKAQDPSAFRKVIGMPQTWWIALIIFCAYMLYVGTYDFPAFAEKGYGQSKTFGAVLGTIRNWMRPLAALLAGILADRFRASWATSACFLIVGGVFITMTIFEPGHISILWVQVLTSALAVFGLRGIYFALLQETGIPIGYTGLAVGVVSFVGYVPDIFAHALSGWFVVNFPGDLGYRYYFGLLAGVAYLGWFASYKLGRRSRTGRIA
jgi:nitrate/nitrite transporter NarK